MKKLTIAALITVTTLSTNVLADETCGDFLNATSRNDMSAVFHSYMSGIGDMSMLDAPQSRSTFLNASTDSDSKASKQWQLQRAYAKCRRLSPSEPLSEVIKATQIR